MTEGRGVASQDIMVSIDSSTLRADLTVPPGSTCLVIFAHGSGSGRKSPRNRFVAGQFHRSGLATLLLDLLTPAEQEIDESTAEFRFDIPLLAGRLVGALDWAAVNPATQAMELALYGASTGAAAALIAAARRPERVRAVVSRGGRVDLAGAALPQVQAPVLMLVGEYDPVVLELNRQAAHELPGVCRLEVIASAGHLLEEPAAMEQVASLSAQWFRQHQSRREAA